MPTVKSGRVSIFVRTAAKRFSKFDIYRFTFVIFIWFWVTNEKRKLLFHAALRDLQREGVLTYDIN